MAHVETAEYTAAREELATQPRQLLRFTNPSVYGSATEFPFSVDFVSQNDLVAPTKAQRPWIMEIGGNTQVVEAELGRSSNGGFRIRLLDADGEMVKYFSNVALTLNGAHDASTTTILVDQDTSGYPRIGTVEILTGGVRERVRYTGKTPTSFTGCTRGVDGTTAASHSNDDAVSNGEWIRLGTRCLLKGGYAHLAEASWCDIQKMEVVGREGHQDRVSVVLKIADINRQPSRATVFLTATSTVPRYLCGNPIDCALAVLISAGTFQTRTGTIAKTVGDATYTGTGTNFTTDLAVGNVVRTSDGEVARVDAITDATHFEAEQPAILSGSSLTFRRGGTGGTYDVLDAVDALGIPSAFVDVTTWEALRASDFATDQYQFDITQPHPGKQFIEEQFFKTLNAYPKINQTGQLSIVRYRVAVGVPTVTLSMDNIRAYGWMPADAQVINRVHFRWDYNVPSAAGQYGAFVEYLAGTKTDFTSSLGLFGPKTPLVVEAMGWRSSLGASTMAANRAKQTTDRFAFPQTILALDCHYTQHHLEVGDQVYVNDPRIPNIRTGGKGIVNEVFEVLDVTPSWRPYHVQFTLLWVAAIPTVATPISQGEVATENPYLTGPVTDEDLDLFLGVEAGTFAYYHKAVFTGSSPRASWRKATSEIAGYVQTSGDRIEYDQWFTGTDAANTVGGLDLAWIERGPETAQSATSTTLVLNAGASGSDDIYNPMRIEIVSNGTPAANGQVRQPTDYVGSTKTATVPTWTTTPTGTIVYRVIRLGSVDFGNDQDGVSLKPSTAVGARALGQWDHRIGTLPAACDGKTLIGMATAMDGAPASVTQEMYIRNPRITTAAGLLAFQLTRFAFVNQVVWAYGTETNVTATMRREIATGAATSTGIANLAVNRGGYAENIGDLVDTTSTTAELTLYTFTAIDEIVTASDIVRFWFKGRISATAPTPGAGNVAIITYRLRRGSLTGPVLSTWTLAVNDAGTPAKGTGADGTNAAFTIATIFGLYVPSVLGSEDFVVTVQRNTTLIPSTARWHDVQLLTAVKTA